MEQEFTGLEAGTYSYDMYLQGGSAATQDIYIYVKINGEVAAKDGTELAGYFNWQNPSIEGVEVKAGDVVTIGIAFDIPAGAWGTMDDFYFYKK